MMVDLWVLYKFHHFYVFVFNYFWCVYKQFLSVLKHFVLNTFKALELVIKMLCNNCGKECKNKGSLANHIKACTGKPPSCTYCKLEFFNQQSLKRHISNCKEYLKHREIEESTKLINEQNKHEIERIIQEKQNEINRINQEKQDEISKLKTLVLKLETDKQIETTKLLTRNECLTKENQDLKTLNFNLSNKPSIQNNNTIVNNGIMTSNLVPLTDELIKDTVKKLDPLKHKNLDSMCSVLMEGIGPSGVLKDSSRQVLELNIEGKIIKDPKGKLLCNKIAKHPSIIEKKEEYTALYCKMGNDHLNRMAKTAAENDKREEEKTQQKKIAEDKKRRDDYKQKVKERNKEDNELYDNSEDEKEEKKQEDRPIHKQERIKDQIYEVEQEQEPANFDPNYQEILCNFTNLSNPLVLQKHLPKNFPLKNNPREAPVIVDPLEGIIEKVKKFCDRGIGGPRGFLNDFLFSTPEGIASCLDEYFDIKKLNFKVIGDNKQSFELTKEKIEIIIRTAFEHNCPGLNIPEVILKSMQKIVDKREKESLERFRVNLKWARREDLDTSFMDEIMKHLKAKCYE